ncbi:MAG: aspartate dehydrogenase [Oscillospiraceae bacterium]|nr:aspartate dehydrogenase [Oscillospiraceae bacterium]
MFGRRRKRQVPPYDKTGKVPVIRSSICTGEQVAGFKDLSSGRFEELMLIRSGADLLEFTRLYQVEEDEIRREW